MFEQQNYKGFDIAVSIRRYKGISAYVISSEKRLIREESATFADKEDDVPLGTEKRLTDIWNSKNVEKKKKAERSAIALRSDGAAARCQCTVRLFGKTDPESDAEPL